MDAPAIHLTNVRKSFGKTRALRGVSLDIGAGEIFGFLGPNGAGKSTLVNMILGLVRPTAGSIEVFGHAAGTLEARRCIGFLPETFRFHEWLRGRELLEFHARMAGLPKAQRQGRVEQMLETVGLSRRGDDRISSYSKGMQQRIGIAQALVGDPPLVVLDEPTSALDPIGRRDVRDLVQRLQSAGTTVFLNSHLLSEIERVCDRVAIITRGEVVASGDLGELLETREVELRLGEGAQAALELLTDEFGPMRSVNGHFVLRVANEGAVAALVRRLVTTNVPVYDVRMRADTLEDLFVRLAEGTGE